MDIKILDEALYDTYTKYAARGGPAKSKKNGIDQIVAALILYLKKNEAQCFSNRNKGRDNIVKNIKREDLAQYLSEYFFQMSKLKQPESDEDFVFGLKMLSLGHDAAVDQIKKCLLGQQKNIGALQATDIARVVCSKYSNIEMKQMDQDREKFNQKVEQTIDPKYGVSNLNVNQGLVNYCREEVLNGRQIAIQNEQKEKHLTPRPRREYILNDELMATTDMGNIRNTQQDSVLMLYHPKNPKYKLLVVADGMGGTVDGDKASQEITKQMVSWFESLPTEIFEDKNGKNLETEWSKKLNQINERILATEPDSGSTYVGAIVGENFTTVASVGDSRCYIFDAKDHLQQVTVDDNLGFLAFKKKWDDYMKSENRRQLKPAELRLMRAEKETLRFKRGNNQITRCLGARKEGPVQASFTRLKNESYKALMLFSDGVTDCLSDTELYAITRKTSPKKLATKIVDKAVSTFSLRQDLKDNPQYVSRIEAGKDNASAVVFDKRKDEEGER